VRQVAAGAATHTRRPRRAENVPAALHLARSRSRRLAAAGVAVTACALSFVRFGFAFDGFAACFFVCVLVALAAIDLERHILPNRILLPAIAVLGAAQLAADPGTGWRRLVWGAGVFGVLLALALAYPAGLGMGDVKLAFFLGLGLGRSVIAAMLLGCLSAGIAAVVVLARYGLAGRKIALPFGPFLALGAIVVLFTLGPR
jgi:leader peptidase (prepilin peptidase) / N-methyltransferase